VILFCDVESSDLLRGDLPLGDPAQPWCVSIGAELATNDGESVDFFSTRIRSDGRMIRSCATEVHGITSRQAARQGVSELAALGMLMGFAAQAKIVVGHGIDFDRKVIESQLLRLGKDARMWVRPGLQFVCTMLAAVAICRIPGTGSDGQFKWPKLDETLAALGLPPRPSPHTAWSDLQSTKAAYFALKARNLLEVAA
jgi:DNA polymerase III epsilon subunit-like protein